MKKGKGSVGGGRERGIEKRKKVLEERWVEKDWWLMV